MSCRRTSSALPVCLFACRGEVPAWSREVPQQFRMFVMPHGSCRPETESWIRPLLPVRVHMNLLRSVEGGGVLLLIIHRTSKEAQPKLDVFNHPVCEQIYRPALPILLFLRTCNARLRHCVHVCGCTHSVCASAWQPKTVTVHPGMNPAECTDALVAAPSHARQLYVHWGLVVPGLWSRFSGVVKVLYGYG